MTSRSATQSRFAVLLAVSACWLITVAAVLAVASSVTFVAISAHTMIGTLPRELPPWVYNLTVCIISGCALAKPAVFVAVAHQRSITGSAPTGMYIYCFIILVANWLTIAIVIVPWDDGFSVTDMWLVGSILVLEISSGFLPPLVYRLVTSKSHAAGPTDQKQGPVEDCVTPIAPQLVPPACEPREPEDRAVHRRSKGRNSGFTKIGDLLLHARSHREDFPKLRFDDAGNMMASCSAIARALGVSSTSTAHARLHREKAAGLIDFETFTTHTRISLVAEKAPSQRMDDGGRTEPTSSDDGEHGDLNFETPLVRIKNGRD